MINTLVGTVQSIESSSSRRKISGHHLMNQAMSWYPKFRPGNVDRERLAPVLARILACIMVGTENRNQDTR